MRNLWSSNFWNPRTSWAWRANWTGSDYTQNLSNSSGNPEKKIRLVPIQSENNSTEAVYPCRSKLLVVKPDFSTQGAGKNIRFIWKNRKLLHVLLLLFYVEGAQLVYYCTCASCWMVFFWCNHSMESLAGWSPIHSSEWLHRVVTPNKNNQTRSAGAIVHKLPAPSYCQRKWLPTFYAWTPAAG